MADPTIVQGTGAASASGSTTIAAAAISTTTGNFLIAVVNKYQSGTTVTGVSDTAGNTYTRAGSSQGGDSNHTQETWYTADPITGNASNVVTATFSGSSSYRTIAVMEVSLSGAPAMAYDAEASIRLTPNGATHTSNSLTTGGADALFVLGVVSWASDQEYGNDTATIVWESGSAALDSAAIAYRLTDAAGSYTGSVTTGGNTELALTAKSFTFTVSGGPTLIPRTSLLGVG